MPRGRDWTSDGHNGDAVEQGVGEAADLWVAPGPEVATCGCVVCMGPRGGDLWVCCVHGSLERERDGHDWPGCWTAVSC
ncbi:hypothetical protein CsSME_00026899 [Camellia sinensis var. sinensis]